MHHRALIVTMLAAVAANADTINVPGDYPTIQIAINIAQDGDEIHVAPGTYFEDIDFLAKDISVRGTGGPDVTTIRGEGLPVPVISVSGATAGLEGFTVSSVTPDNNPSQYGGGLYASGAILTITDCVFDSNSAGIDSSGGGGAMWLNDSDTTIIDTVLTGNTSNWAAGAVSISGGYATFINCTITDSDAATSGGGVYANGEAVVSLSGCTVQNNVTGSVGGGVRVIGGCLLEIRNSLFFNNHAATHGGGIAVSDFSDAIVESTRFESNVTERGGATFSDNDDSTITANNCIFVANVATAYGGASYVAHQATFTNCTYYNNIAPDGDGGTSYAAAGGGSSIAARNCVYVGQTPTKQGAGSMSFKYCNLPDAPGGNGNISADPMFVNAFSGDYHLAEGSPCIDAGNTDFVLVADPEDADGNPRAVDEPDVQNTGITLLGLTVDMGAYEVQVDQTVCTADANGDGLLNILDFVTFQQLFQLGCD